MVGNNTFLTSTLAGSVIILLYGIYGVYGYRRNAKIVGNTPGIKTLFSMSRFINIFLPSWRIPWTGWMLTADKQWWLLQNHRGMYKAEVVGHSFSGNSIRTVRTRCHIRSKPFYNYFIINAIELYLPSSHSTIFQVR